MPEQLNPGMQDFLPTNCWDSLPPQIVETSRRIAETGKFDDAIFAAFRLLEATIQERIGSKNIGEALIDEAFNEATPKIVIAVDARDARGIKSLFSGALTIRNDRGHKFTPMIPCRSIKECFLYLGFAGLLLNLLAKDKNIFPRVDNLRVFGSVDQPRAEIIGANFKGLHTRVLANGADQAIAARTQTALEILLPANFVGDLTVVVDDRESESRYCDTSTLSKATEGFTRVVEADIPLYSDKNCENRREDFVGILLENMSGARPILSISPTHARRYKRGHYVAHGTFDFGNIVDETWYRDPLNGKIEYAWTSSVVVTPELVSPCGDFKLGGISIRPSPVRAQVGESRALRVIARERDGKITREVDVTARAKWKCLNESVAYIDSQGILLSKTLGKTLVNCEVGGYTHSAEVSVVNMVGGDQSIYFQGLRRLQQIKCDSSDNLFLCNQGPSVYKLSKKGRFDEVLQLSNNNRTSAGIDCIALDAMDNLYVSDGSKRAVFRFELRNGIYCNPIEIATQQQGVPKGIAITKSGIVFCAILGSAEHNRIVRRDPNGSETTFGVSGLTFHLAPGPDEHIYATDAQKPRILVFDSNGNQKRVIEYRSLGAICDIAVDDKGSIFLGFFQPARILVIRQGRPDQEISLGNINVLGGLALDKQGRIFASDFEGDSVTLIYP